LNDLVYLTDPFIRTTDFVLDPEQKIDPFSCEAVEVEHPEGYVTRPLSGTNPFLTEFAAEYKLPPEAASGGAETMYPEDQLTLTRYSSTVARRDSQTR
jgi:hypothetical protein